MSPQAGLPIRMTPDDLRTFREGIKGKMSWFWYATPNLTFTGPGAPAQQPQLVIDARSDFLAMAVMGFNDRATASIVAPLGDFYTIEISESGSSRNYQSAPLHSELAVGNAREPHYLLVPILFRASASISINVIPLNTGAVTYNIRLALGGVKIYRE